ncbi:hypothetical protein WJX74_005611 [Apatococcus lobatus]|uniref:Uncharacterized protein n=1 Tax=Apatococcus lobatus TaxID=904363 RepID=A0AAW1SBR4_9CHLO
MEEPTPVLCPVRTQASRSPEEEPSRGGKPDTEIRAYKLGGARCSYNQIRVTVQELGGSKQLTVHEAHQEGDHLLDEAQKEAGIVYRLLLSNQQVIWLRIFLVHVSPQASDDMPASLVNHTSTAPDAMPPSCSKGKGLELVSSSRTCLVSSDPELSSDSSPTASSGPLRTAQPQVSTQPSPHAAASPTASLDPPPAARPQHFTAMSSPAAAPPQLHASNAAHRQSSDHVYREQQLLSLGLGTDTSALQQVFSAGTPTLSQAMGQPLSSPLNLSAPTDAQLSLYAAHLQASLTHSNSAQGRCEALPLHKLASAGLQHSLSQPQPTHLPTAHLSAVSQTPLKQTNVQQQHAHAPGSAPLPLLHVQRASCKKGCRGPILQSIKRMGRLGKKPPPSSGQSRRSLAMYKEPNCIYLSIDEAATHVGARTFRLVVGALAEESYKLLGSCCSPPIRVMANNDCPGGAADFSIHLALDPKWPGWAIPSCPDPPSHSPPQSPTPSTSQAVRLNDAPSPLAPTSSAIRRDGSHPEKQPLENRTFQRSPPGMPKKSRSPVADTHAPEVQWGSKKRRLHASPLGQKTVSPAAGNKSEDLREDALPVGPHDRQLPGIAVQQAQPQQPGTTPDPSQSDHQRRSAQPHAAGNSHSSGVAATKHPTGGAPGCMLQEISPDGDTDPGLQGLSSAGVQPSKQSQAIDPAPGQASSFHGTAHEGDVGQPQSDIAVAACQTSPQQVPGRHLQQPSSIPCVQTAVRHRQAASGEGHGPDQQPTLGKRRRLENLPEHEVKPSLDDSKHACGRMFLAKLCPHCNRAQRLQVPAMGILQQPLSFAGGSSQPQGLMELASDNPMLPIWLLQQGLSQHHRPTPPLSYPPPALYPPPAAPAQLADPPKLSAAAGLLSYDPRVGPGQSAFHSLAAAAGTTPFPVAAAATAEAAPPLNTHLAISHPAVFPPIPTPSAEPIFSPGTASAALPISVGQSASHPALFPSIQIAAAQPIFLHPGASAGVPTSINPSLHHPRVSPATPTAMAQPPPVPATAAAAVTTTDTTASLATAPIVGSQAQDWAALQAATSALKTLPVQSTAAAAEAAAMTTIGDDRLPQSSAAATASALPCLLARSSHVASLPVPAVAPPTIIPLPANPSSASQAVTPTAFTSEASAHAATAGGPGSGGAMRQAHTGQAASLLLDKAYAHQAKQHRAPSPGFAKLSMGCHSGDVHHLQGPRRGAPQHEPVAIKSEVANDLRPAAELLPAASSQPEQ